MDQGVGRRRWERIEGRSLMRVFSVPQRADPLEGEDEVLGKGVGLADRAREIPRDRGVVGRGSRERAGGEALARREPGAARRTDLLEEALIVRRIHQDRDPGVVLRGGPDERRPAHVDHLDRLGSALARGHGLFEGIQVHDDQVERLDPGLRHVPHVVRPRIVRQDPGEDLGMKRLDAASEDLRKPGHLLDQRNRDAGFPQARRGAARRNDRDASLGQSLPERDQARLVVDGDQSPPHRDGGGGEVRNGLGHRTGNIPSEDLEQREVERQALDPVRDDRVADLRANAGVVPGPVE